MQRIWQLWRAPSHLLRYMTRLCTHYLYRGCNRLQSCLPFCVCALNTMSLHHTPPSRGPEQASDIPAGPSHIEVPHGIAPPLEPLIDMGSPFCENVIESITACKIPPFWKQQPAWFAQIESLFQIYRICSDDSRYHLVIGALDSEAIQEIADILASCLALVIDKYVTLKTQLLARFADSADKQLHRLFTDLELGNRKLSQLLRHMRTLAGDRVSQDILRVRWLALLPPIVQRVLKILRTTCLEELSTVADELMEGSSVPQVLTVTAPRALSPCRTGATLADN
ncbi:uncharacterized protein LOC112589203 [Harpegnathos saltator]|uniref:uncharacterized protein LOC112589203 n=1 Tax=Harpegnathos saltator TaxID=610380 RepID=UPI000DBED422|nr:uncharacterized protein LOC112589203 [Harpegnathos saltator]